MRMVFNAEEVKQIIVDHVCNKWGVTKEAIEKVALNNNTVETVRIVMRSDRGGPFRTPGRKD